MIEAPAPSNTSDERRAGIEGSVATVKPASRVSRNVAGDVDLRAKSGKPLARYFPEVVAHLESLPMRRFVLDGELLIEIDGHLAFDALQMRLHPAESRVRKLTAATPARLMLFDILAGSDGRSLLKQPLDRRREKLETFFAHVHAPEALALSPLTYEHQEAERWLDEGVLGTDGVIAKRRDGLYETGERAMVKVKHLRTADCVVGGFRYAQDRRGVGSLLLGLYDDDGLLDHVGFTSTISNAERAELTDRLESMEHSPGFTGKAPGGPSRWSTDRTGDWVAVRPELVVEVRFDHVTGNRFRHGTKLIRWRPDKAPRQCTLDQIAPLSGAPRE
ncbi:ATP-dependent DNA ligase [Aquabacter sp. CN5-332]|uniref:ATP-dependent DNA ligase n=1 Tax=Aquabacter sp. CN5-332 TaxID=3156608 RepID=UPI0032B3785A